MIKRFAFVDHINISRTDFWDSKNFQHIPDLMLNLWMKKLNDFLVGHSILCSKFLNINSFGCFEVCESRSSF